MLILLLISKVYQSLSRRCWEAAQHQYEEAIMAVQVETEGLREAEFKLWEEHWQRCMEQLGHFDLLHRFAHCL
jgi:hypothetical protein